MMNVMTSRIVAHNGLAASYRASLQRRTSFLAPAQKSSRPLVRRSMAAAVAAAVDLPTATDAPGSMRSSELPAAINTMNAARKVLRSMGWDDAWIDGVVGEIRKGKLQTSAEQIEAIVAYLSGSVKIPMKAVENMAAVAPELLGMPLEQVQAVVEYVRRQGLADDFLVRLLEEHPKVLTYAVAGDGKALQKGAARASIDLSERQGRRVAGVSYWREGAAFQTAPVAPLKPSVL